MGEIVNINSTTQKNPEYKMQEDDSKWNSFMNKFTSKNNDNKNSSIDTNNNFNKEYS